MKKKELKRIIFDVQNQLYECERYALQLKRERDDAIQEREAAEMALGEQAGSGSQVDREVRIGGEEETQEKEEGRLAFILHPIRVEVVRGDYNESDLMLDHVSVTTFSSYLEAKDAKATVIAALQRLGIETIDGNEKDAGRPDDASGSGIDSYSYVDTRYPIFGGYADRLQRARCERAESEAAERQAGILAGDGERERTD